MENPLLTSGRDYRIEIAETASGDVEFSRFFLVPAAHQAKRRDVLRDWYIARAKEKILDRVEQHARELGVSSKRPGLLTIDTVGARAPSIAVSISTGV